MLQILLQTVAIICFLILAITDLVAKNWTFFGINLSLVSLYIFLYFGSNIFK